MLSLAHWFVSILRANCLGLVSVGGGDPVLQIASAPCSWSAPPWSSLDDFFFFFSPTVHMASPGSSVLQAAPSVAFIKFHYGII